MQAIRRIIKVPSDREIRIQLPEEAKAFEEAEVIILFKSSVQEFEEKLLMMREAATDPLFLADLEEIDEEFKYADKDESLV